MARLRWASGIALIALTASACGMGGGDDNGGAGEDGGSDGGHIVFADFTTPAAGWAVETDDAHALMRAGCLETLIRYKNDGELEPALATEWNQVEPTVWEITLREDVTFQDGTPLDGDAVAGALTHLLEAETPARGINPDNVTSVEAADDTTVRVTTPAPDALIPLRLAGPNAGILAPKAYEADQIDIQGTCTGPFTVTGEAPQESLSLERNENYWGGEVGLATAEVRFIVDGAARATQLQTGESHLVRSIPAASRSIVEGDENVEIQEQEVPRTTVMLLNHTRAPFDDPLVRKAIQMSIDTQAIVDGVYEGTGSPAVGPFSPTSPWGTEGAEPVAVDQDEARSLLEQAGVDPASLEFELIAYNERPELGDVAAVIQDQLGQLGITVNIRAGETASFEPDWLAGNYDATLLSRGYTTDVADPASYLRSDWTCEGSYNIAQYCDPNTDQVIQEALANQDLDAAIQQKAEIGAQLQEEAAAVWLLHEGAVWGSRSDVQGFEPHLLSYYVLTADLTVG